MKALKDFAYSRDGIHAIQLRAGDDASDVPESALAGLIAEGYIGDGAHKAGKVKNKATQPPETGAPVALDDAADKGDAE